MNNKKIAEEILQLVGKENISHATHCMTRLRLTLKDESIVDDNAVGGVDGVLGVVHSGGQYQIIIGQNVSKVYPEVCKMLDIKESAAVEATEEKIDGEKEKLTLKGAFNNVLNYLSGSLTPLIPILMAACMFKTFLAIFGPDMLGVLSAESNLYKTLDFLYDAGFYFFPIFIGYSAAKKLGATPVLGAYLGAILIAPDFLAIVNAGEAFTVFGIPCALNDYSQSVFPAILSVAVMYYVEKFFKKYLPDVLSTIFAPFLTMLVMAPIALCALAPLGSFLGNYICNGLIAFGNVGGFVAVALVAALWEFLVMGGMHMVFIVMMLSLIVQNGSIDGVLVAGSFATFAVFGTALGAILRMKNKKERSFGLGCFISGLVGGVTEPTLYGLCFKHRRTFIGMIIGGAVGGAYAGLTHVKCMFSQMQTS